MHDALPEINPVPVVPGDERTWDACVVGAGPAGLSAASALAARGLDVLILSPSWPPQWPNNYGLWRDEVAHDPELVACASIVYDAPTFIGPTGVKALDRPYLKLDNARVFGVLAGRAARAGARAAIGMARGIEHRRASSCLRVEDASGASREVRARVVVDASGAGSTLVSREGRARPAFQTAYGHVIEDPDDRVLRGHDMFFMDFTPLGAGDDLATFLYAMRLPDGRVFVEETAMTARPRVGLDVLERRLERRLAMLGLDAPDALGPPERCVIPMGLALPSREDRAVAYGAAASMVHPASGYQLARALNWADGLADALAHELAHGASPARAARAAHDAIWTKERRACRALYMFGLEALLEFPPERTRRFFGDFLELPDTSWQGFLSGTLSRAQLALVMLRLFRNVSPGMRVSLARPALGRNASHLLRAISPGARGAR